MSSPSTIALAVAAPLAVAAAWIAVRRWELSIWVAMGTTVGVLGGLALVTGRIRGSAELDGWVAAGLGLGAGVLLYAATAAFMAVAGRWPPVARHTAALYDQRQGVSLGAALALAVVVVSPGEELLWRGVVQSELSGAAGPVAGPILGWAGYIGANAASGSIPILLGAVVAGGVWTALAAWTGGVLAGIACHAAWTGLMIVRPPVGEPR